MEGKKKAQTCRLAVGGERVGSNVRVDQQPDQERSDSSENLEDKTKSMTTFHAHQLPSFCLWMHATKAPKKANPYP